MIDERLKEKVKYIRKQEVLRITEKDEYIDVWYFDKNKKESCVLRLVYDKAVYSWLCMRLKPVIITSFADLLNISKNYTRKYEKFS